MFDILVLLLFFLLVLLLINLLLSSSNLFSFVFKKDGFGLAFLFTNLKGDLELNKLSLLLGFFFSALYPNLKVLSSVEFNINLSLPLCSISKEFSFFSFNNSVFSLINSS